MCKDCERQFITDYIYNGCKKWIRALIVPLTINSSGIRDISRVLHMSVNTVLKTIKAEAGKINLPPPDNEVLQQVEIDELWSYVGSKKNQQWLWYGWDREHKKLLRYLIGPRTDKSCEQLMTQLSEYQIEQHCSDKWQSYPKFIDPEKHVISKKETQNIERKNLDFRTHLKRLSRRTICFSKSPEMHEAVVKLYIYHTKLQAA